MKMKLAEDEARLPIGSRDEVLLAAREEECCRMMMYEDVVCNRPIDACRTAWVSRYHGGPYFFCSLACREQFELEPEDFLPHAEVNPVPTSVMLRFVS
jgi:YHS domain-containing protein